MNPMRLPLRSILAAASLAGAPLAQNTLFLEGFDSGIPPTWTQELLGVGADVWLAGTNATTKSADVYHEYFCTNGTLLRDNRLVTPVIDLRGLRDAALRWDDFQVLPTWRNLNAVEVSVAKGPFTVIHTVTGATGGLRPVAVDVSMAAGRADVRFGFRYRGDIANEWRIDNVRVTTSQPVHSIRGLVAGSTASFDIVGLVSGSAVVLGLSLSGEGPIPTFFGDVLLSPPLFLLPTIVAGASGAVSLAVPIPNDIARVPVWTHGIEFQPSLTVRLTNAVVTTIR